MTHYTAPGMIPELVWSAQRDLEEPDLGVSTLGCVECLQGGLEPQDRRRYMVAGTSYCSSHAVAAARLQAVTP